MAASMTLDEIRDSFAFFDDWEDRYRFIIDLGRGTAADGRRAEGTDANIVRGCQSQVWIDHRLDGRPAVLHARQRRA